MHRREYLGAVFLDLSKAFDTVSHDVLLKKLEHYGIRGNALLLMKSYLTNRKQFVALDGCRSEMRNMDIGVPQGSVLGPLLFLIYINDLPRSVNRLNSILFADDTTLHFSHKDVYSLCDVLTSELARVKDWLLANKLTLNAKKTYFIIFSLKNVPDDVRVSLGSHALDRQLKGKFLGVVLDDKLTFKDHIDMIAGKIAKLIGIIYRLQQYFPPLILKLIYNSLVVPHLSYCILAWGSCSRQVIQPLIIMQKKLIRILTSSDYYAHTSPLFHSLALLKLDDIYNLTLMNIMFQTLTLNKHPSIKQKITQVQPDHRYGVRTIRLALPFTRVKKCEQMYLYQGIKQWNVLPAYLKVLLSISSFKNSYRKYLISMY